MVQRRVSVLLLQYVLYTVSSSCFLTSMGGRTLSFVLLLPLAGCLGTGFGTVTLEKTLGREADVTRLCTNNTQSILTLVVCKIRTKRNMGEECRLLYEHGRGFVHECGSRFSLMMENQTIVLHLTSLTPEDSGNYTCECVHPDGTYVLHLNITVEEEENDVSSSTEMSVPNVLIGVAIVIVITGAILGFIYRRKRHGLNNRSRRPLSTGTYQEAQDIEPYSTFTRRESGLYSVVKVRS